MKLYKALFVVSCLLLFFGCSQKDCGCLTPPPIEPGIDVVSLQVTPPTEQLPIGLSSQFIALAIMSDDSVIDVTNSPSISWISSNNNIAVIDSSGATVALETGKTSITASIKNTKGQSILGTAALTVTPAIVTALQVTPVSNNIPKGLSIGFTATAFLSDGQALNVTENKEIIWSSSNEEIARVASNGIATGLTPGVVKITASGTANNQSFSGTANLTVTDSVVTQLQVTPAVSSIPIGLSGTLHAQATLSDGQVIDVTTDPALTWSSSASQIANISNTEADKGKFTGLSTGVVTMTASGIANGQSFTATAKVTVTPAVVVNLQVTPVTSSIPVGLSEQLIAQATLSDGRVLDVTSDAALSWSSSNTQVATIVGKGTEQGLLTGVTPGTVTITASGVANGQTFKSSVQVIVTDAVVSKLQIEPIISFLPAGLSQQFHAKAIFSDGRVLDVTKDDALSWTVDEPSIATILTSGANKGRLTGITPGNATISAFIATNGQTFTSTAQVTITEAVIIQLQVTPVTESVPVGLTKQFTAIATLSDGRTKDLTNDPTLSWSSDSPNIATINSSQPNHNGLATGVSTGSTTITATAYVDGAFFNATAQLDVTQAVVTALQITPAIDSVPVGLTKPFTAIATLSDGRTQDLTNDPALSWSSDSPSIATINSSQPNHNGLATGVSTGSTTITATAYVDGAFFNATAKLDVTQTVVTALQITPAIDSVPVGLTKPFTAIATLSDGRTQDLTNDPALSWNSDSPSIATIDSSQPNHNGLATGVSTGSTTITATAYVDGAFFNATAQLDVTQAVVTALQITPAIDSVPVGLTKSFTAIATLSDGRTLDVTNDPAINWNSTPSTVATISSNQPEENGITTGVAPGTATITASLAANRTFFSATAQLTVTNAIVTALQVTPTTESVPAGLTKPFTAIATLSDGSTQDVTNDPAINWNSTPSTVATISSNQPEDNGITTGVALGTATITASLAANRTFLSATAQLTVTNAIVTALQVTPTTESVPAGLTKPFTAIATLSDGSTQDVTNDPAISWNSTPSTVATISSNQPGDNGITTGVAPGTATITASLAANRTFLSATAQLTVTNAIVTALQVTPVTESIPVGLTKPFTAIATLSDGRTQDLTNDPALSWSSSPLSIATISSNQHSNNGIATGVTTGTATITATAYVDGTPFNATAQLNVTQAVVTALQVTPVNESVPAGLTKAFTAIATLSDGSTQDVTNNPSLSWSSNALNIVTISSNQSDSNGIATGVSIGTATITASGTVNRAFFSATAQLTVTDAVITALEVSPVTEFVPVGLTKAFTAIATFSDGRMRDVTNEPTLSWSSDAPSIATISSNQLDNNGLATGVSPGIATITASGTVNKTFFSATAQLTVTDAVITGLEISPATQSVPVGLTKTFIATAIFSDGNTQDVTNEPAISWSSSPSSVATISSSQPEHNGVVTGVTPGTAMITVSGSVNRAFFSATAQLTVTNAVVTALVIEPKTDFVPIGLTKPFSAIATMSDGEVIDVTNQPALSWSTMPLSVATISSNQPDSNGITTGVALGTATVTASGTTNGMYFSATAQLTVTNAALVAISITPSSLDALSLGRNTSETSRYIQATKQLKAIGQYSDGSNTDITKAVLWSTNNSDAMSVNATGVIKAGGSGNATISASLDGISSSVESRAVPWIDVFTKPDPTRRNYALANSFCTDLGLRLGSVNEMKALFVDSTLSPTAYPDSGYRVDSSMCSTHGWPLGSSCGGSSNGYWTKLSGSTYYSVHLNSGERVTSGSSNGYYTACMLN